MSKHKIQLIIGSTRPTRIGDKIGNWLAEIANQNENLDVEVVDLKDYDLPFLNEPEKPSSNKYSKDYTIKWSEKVKQADGYIWLTPEYNASYTAVIKNAIDYLYSEWDKKPVLIASYGVGGGGTANKHLTDVAERLHMVVSSPTLQLAVGPDMRGEDGQTLLNFEKDFEQYKEKATESINGLAATFSK